MTNRVSGISATRRSFLKGASTAAPAVFVPSQEAGKKGKVYPDERRKYRDSRSGRVVWQMTNTPGRTAVAQYSTQTMTTPDGHYLVYGSDRAGERGQWNLFKMDLRTGVSVQLTESSRGLNYRWSHISPDGKVVYYMEDKNLVKPVNIETFEEREICRLENCFRPHQFTVSPDNRYLINPLFMENKDEDAFLVKQGFLIRSALIVIDIQSGKTRRLCDGNTPRTHAQYCPADPNLLLYCYGGPWWYVQRLWLIHPDGTGNRPIFVQTNFEGVGHEFWSDDGKRIYATCNGGRQPQGLWAMDVTGENQRCVLAGACVGHGTANPAEDRFVIDDLYNDCKTGLWTSRKGSAGAELLCQTGTDWAGKSQDYHPHPRFLPDGGRVAFSSAMSGSCEFYVVEV